MKIEKMAKKVSFKQLINSEKPVLIDFSAVWCGPCQAMNPILKDVAKSVGDKAKIIKIDVDKNATLAADMGVRGVPTFMLFQNGEKKWHQAGMQSAVALENVINQALTGKL